MSDETPEQPKAPETPETPAAAPAPETPAADAKPAESAAPAEAPAPAPAAAPAKAPLSDEEKAAMKAAALEKAAAAKAAKAAAAGTAGGTEGVASTAAGAAAPAAKPKPVHEEDPNKPIWEKDPTAPEWQDGASDPLTQALKDEFGDAIETARSYAGDLTFLVRRDAIAQVVASLKDKHRFTYLIDICGADYPKREPRFDVVYHLYSFEANRRIRLKVVAGEDTPVPTLCNVYRAANWPEREAYDMYGVRFEGHPDMTRILLWEGFNGYPLRKDFPVEGIDTGSAIYPEYYNETAGPVQGAGTGWKPPKPPEPPAPPAAPAAPAVEKPAAEPS